MANPEILRHLKMQDVPDNDQEPVEGKSFDNLRRFVAYGTVTPARSFPPGEKPNYSNGSIYYPSATQNELKTRNRDLIMFYEYISTEKTGDEIGRQHSLTRERVRQIVKRIATGLHEGADEANRDHFPFESFDFRKPLTLAHRQRMSEESGGRTVDMARKIDQGASLDELKKVYTPDQILKARPVLESWGYQLEREKHPSIISEFEGLDNEYATDKEIQAHLDKISNYRQRSNLKKAGLILDLTTVTKRAGLHLNASMISLVSESLAKELLPQGKIPITIIYKNQEKVVYYRFIAAIDEPNAIDIISKDQSLDRFR